MLKLFARWWSGGSPRGRHSSSRLQLAYKTRSGKRVWLYDTFIQVSLPGDSWEQVRGLPRWVQKVLSERPEDYQSPAHDEGFSLLINGKRFQYLYWTYCGAHGQGNFEYEVMFYRRKKSIRN